MSYRGPSVSQPGVKTHVLTFDGKAAVVSDMSDTRGQA